jgi:predicted transcriptional regulator
MAKNADYSKKILKILAENKAVSVPELAEKMALEGEKLATKARYAINRSLKGLLDSGLIESHFSGQNDYATH